MTRTPITDETNAADDAQAVLARAYEREQEAARRLRELDRLRAEFLSTASHELRTPLTVVMGFTRMLVGRWDTLDDATRIHLIKRIAASGQRLEQVITDMLDFTRAEDGRIDVALEEHALDTLAHDAAFKIDALLDGHTLEVAVPPGIVVLADRALTNRIFENLLTNALKFSPSGTHVVIGVDTNADDELVVSVTDDGPGIPEAERERIFERFHRVDDDAAARGTGIGLAITKAFVEAQGGRIWMQPNPGGGSCFCFTALRPGVRLVTEARSGP